MAWSITDLFPPWGDSGSKPADNFQYDGGDQVNEKHLDYLWASVGQLENEVRSALQDIDADQDGVVDLADDSNLLSGNTLAQVQSHAPAAHAGSHKDGGADELDAAELAGALGTSGQVLTTDGAAASWSTGSLYTDEQAQDAVGGILSADFTYDDAGNAINMNPHSGDASAHHARYTDEEARDAIGAALVGGTDITITVDDGANTITVAHTDTSTISNVNTSGLTVIDNISWDGRGHATSRGTRDITEAVQDAIGNNFGDGLLYDDSAGTFEAEVTSGQARRARTYHDRLVSR